MSSEKKVLRDMLHEIRHDCRSVTGKNIRTLKLEAKKPDNSVNIDQMPYATVPTNENWRINFAAEIIAIKVGDLALCNISYADLDVILEEICCHQRK